LSFKSNVYDSGFALSPLAATDRPMIHTAESSMPRATKAAAGHDVVHGIDAVVDEPDMSL
jgi:hypothetical protein